MIANVENQVITAHTQHHNALRRLKTIEVHVLATKRDDTLADRARTAACGRNAVCRLGLLSPRLRRVIGNLDDLTNQSEGIRVEAIDRDAVQRFSSEQDRLSQPKVIDGTAARSCRPYFH